MALSVDFLNQLLCACFIKIVRRNDMLNPELVWRIQKHIQRKIELRKKIISTTTEHYATFRICDSTNYVRLRFNRFHAGDAMEEDNRLMCEELTGIPVIACVADGATDIQLDADFLASLYE